VDVNEAFDIFQRKVDADPVHVRKARHRQGIFRDALLGEPDVLEVIPSGSLARGTQLDPIHDVDLIAVYEQDAHPTWGEPGQSARAALAYTQGQVRSLIGDQSSIIRKVVGETRIRNHVVKCFLDPRFLAEDPDFKSFFAVEVMPAMRTVNGLLVPERRKESWQTVDPEWLIAEVRRRQQQWPYFLRAIRVIKSWSRHADTGMKSLAAEVLALKCLPPPYGGGLSRSAALLRFFTAGSSAAMLPVEDPAGNCGVIQPDLKCLHVSSLLSEAADIAAKAVAWEEQGEDHRAICSWRAVFGDDFPEPPGGCPGSDGGGRVEASGESGDARPAGGRIPGGGTGPGPPPGPGGRAPDGPGGPGAGHNGGGGPGGGGSGGGNPVAPGTVPPAQYPSNPYRRVKDAPQG
jgi:hypothetical protein